MHGVRLAAAVRVAVSDVNIDIEQCPNRRPAMETRVLL